MKKNLLSLVALLGLALTTQAQEIPVPKWFDPIGQEARQLVKTTPEQEQEIKAQHKNLRKKIATVQKDNTLDKQQKEAAIKKLRTERSNYYFNEILTPEQSTQLKTIQKAKDAERQRAIRDRKKQKSQK